MNNTCEAVCAVRRVYFDELPACGFDARRVMQIVNPIFISPREKYTGMSCAVMNILHTVRPRINQEIELNPPTHKLHAADFGHLTRRQFRRNKRYKRII